MSKNGEINIRRVCRKTVEKPGRGGGRGEGVVDCVMLVSMKRWVEGGGAVDEIDYPHR